MSNWVVWNIGLGKGKRARKRMTKAGPILKSPGGADEGLEASPGQGGPPPPGVQVPGILHKHVPFN